MLFQASVLFATIFGAYVGVTDKDLVDMEAKEGVKIAVCEVSPTQGNKVKGKVVFTQQANGVQIEANFTGLTPGLHGFHVHEKGDCSAHDASSAGGHFNPTNKHHGGPDDEDRHVGDFGNVEADDEGVGHYSRLDKVISLNGPDSIVGKSIVIHKDPDDLHTQPTGNSGARIGCGVIVIQK